MFRHWLVGFGLLALSLGGAANAHADELNGDWARANRFAIGFGVGVASVSMTRFGDFAADGVAMLRRQTTSLTLDGDLKQGAALSTLITTIGGLFSLAVGLGGKSLIWGPMAASIVWGLGFATALTLFVVLLLYWVFMRPSAPRRGRLLRRFSFGAKS